MTEWGMTAFFWTVSLMRLDGIFLFFVIWARILHYIDIARMLTVHVFKFVGMAMDEREDYLIEGGLDMDAGAVNTVSMIQALSGTDWYMESFGLTVSFSLYGDLIGIGKNVDANAVVAGAEEAIGIEEEVIDENDDEMNELDGVDEF